MVIYCTDKLEFQDGTLHIVAIDPEHPELKEVLARFFEVESRGLHIAVVCAPDGFLITNDEMVKLLQSHDRNIIILDQQCPTNIEGCGCAIIAENDILDMLLKANCYLAIALNSSAPNKTIAARIENRKKMLAEVRNDPDVEISTVYTKTVAEVIEHGWERTCEDTPQGGPDIRLLAFVPEEEFAFFADPKCRFPRQIENVVRVRPHKDIHKDYLTMRKSLQDLLDLVDKERTEISRQALMPHSAEMLNEGNNDFDEYIQQLNENGWMELSMEKKKKIVNYLISTLQDSGQTNIKEKKDHGDRGQDR